MKKHNTHDSGYKMLFSNHEMVRQLLTSFVDEEWIHELEFGTLERIDKSFVSDRFEERESKSFVSFPRRRESKTIL